MRRPIPSPPPPAPPRRAAAALLLALALAAPPARGVEPDAPAADAASPADVATAPAPPPPLGPADLPALAEKARALGLASSLQWRRLGHWRPARLGGVYGQNDSPAFYLAPAGRRDPAAELEATLAGLLAPPPAGAAELDDAACRFPARARWLAGALGFDLAALPPRTCQKQGEFVARVSARSVTLIFSSYYLNSPASAFGHTFLRLNKAEGARPGKAQELLDYGVDYSAQVDTGNAVLYAFKGLFGLFKGTFNHYPYYYKVREYADYESRDLWEYDLDLTPEEVTRLVEHLWELGGGWFDYWYLDENCSYHVLGALEAAAPRLDLLGRLGARPLVVPADTVKALVANPGLVRSVQWRPAVRTQFEARARALSWSASGAVLDLFDDPAAPLPAGLSTAEAAAALDAAVDLVDLRHGKGILMGEKPAAAKARQALLVRRASLRVASPELDLPRPDAQRPEAGHGSLRAGLGAGWIHPAGGREAGPAALLDLRLCLHDLLDPPDGYPAHAQIEFLPLRLRWDQPSSRLELDDGSLVRILSLSPVSRFDLRPSWQFRAGGTTVRDAGCDRCTAGLLSVGGGFSASLAGGAVDAAALADVELLAAGRLSGWGESPVRAGVGPTGLVRWRLGSRAALLASGSWRWLPEASPRETWGLELSGRLHLGRNVSLGLEGRRRPGETAAGLVAYFYDAM